MHTLTINPTLAARLAHIAERKGKTQEQVIDEALTQYSLRPIPELSPETAALFSEIETSENFSNHAIIQRYGLKEL